MKKLVSLMAFATMLFTASNAFASGKIITFKAGTTAQQRQSQIEALGGTLARDYEFINAALANFPDGKTIQSAELARRAPNALSQEENSYRIWLNELGYSSLPGAAGVLSQARDGDGAVTVPQALSPETTAGSALRADSKQIPWGIKRVKADSVWTKYDGTGVKVGIVDTGIDLTHPDLRDNIAGSYNALKPESSANDDQGHGSHVAGTIAGEGVDGGVYGVAPKATLYAAKALDAQGGGTVDSVIAGINWVIGQKVNVINMSLGSTYSSEALRQAVQAAYDAGITVVCAAGNNGGAVNYPAAYEPAIAVSASNSSDLIAYFSCRGPQIAFIAPGISIYSTYKNGGYSTLDGTSMASPHVAGLAALAVQAGATDPGQVLSMLKNSASELPGLTANQQGNGMIDATKIAR